MDDSPEQRITQFYATLSRTSLAHIGSIYSDDAYFKDPFNEVTGLANIRRIFEHMYEQVDSPRFVILESISEPGKLVLTWDFIFARKGAPKHLTTVRGASLLKLDAQGKITYHRDYWDVAEELYEKVPVLGALMRFLKRRLSS